MTTRRRIPDWKLRELEGGIANTITVDRDIDEVIARVTRTDPLALPAAMNVKATNLKVRRRFQRLMDREKDEAKRGR